MGVVFAITKSADLISSMKGHDLILTSKPFYRKEIVLTKICFLVLLLLGHSVFLTLKLVLLTLPIGPSRFEGYYLAFIFYSALIFWLSSLLFAGITALLATRLSARWSIITGTVIFYIGSLLGVSYKPLGILLAAYYHKDVIIPENKLNLSWKNNVLKTQTKNLVIRNQGPQKALSFSEKELEDIKNFDNSAQKSTLIVRVLQWLNIPFQTQAFNPVNYIAKTEVAQAAPTLLTFFNVGDIVTGNYLTINTTKNDISKELLLVKKHQGKTEYFLVPTLASKVSIHNDIFRIKAEESAHQSNKFLSNDDLLVFDTSSTDDFFKQKFKAEMAEIQSAQGEQKNRLQIELNNKIKAYKEKYGGVYKSVFSLSWSDINNLLISEDFSKFMKKFMEKTFFSASEAQRNIGISSSKSVTKEWLNEKLIENIIKKGRGMVPLVAIGWLVAAYYWIYLNYKDERIAKVISAQNEELSNFDPATTFVEIDQTRYGIGGVINSEYPKADDNFKPQGAYHILTAQDNSFETSFLFSFAKNYIVYDTYNGLVNLGIISMFWVLCILLMMFSVFYLLIRKDYK